SVVAWPKSTYAAPPPGLAATAIAAGWHAFLGLRSDGTVASWGSSPPTFIPQLNDVAAIAAARTHFMLLQADGTVRDYAWNDSMTDLTPAGLNGVVKIAGGGQSLALRTDGT